MMDSRHHRTVVLGLGNPVLCDDAVGLAVAADVARQVEQKAIAGVDVVTSTRGGFELIDLLSGYDRAILVDCLAVPQPEPGRVRELSLHDVAGSARLTGAHDLSVQEAFSLARELGILMPEDVRILAVEGAEMTLLSERMTPAVEAAAAQLAERILRLVATEWAVRETGCDHPAAGSDPGC